eukprot:scaffold52159_cov31-Tisochrysis_lutea.AAC.2
MSSVLARADIGSRTRERHIRGSRAVCAPLRHAQLIHADAIFGAHDEYGVEQVGQGRRKPRHLVPLASDNLLGVGKW